MKDWIQTGTPKIGTVVTLPHPAIAEIARVAGFDWIWADAEHGSFDPSSAAVCCGINTGGPKVFIRIPDKSASSLKQYLDVGADGLIIPHVDTLDDVREIARCALYPPQGERSVGIGRAHAYGERFAEYLATRTYSIIVQIESVTAVANVAQILASPIVDAAIIGPFDLSGSHGVTGQVTAPQVLESMATVLAAAKQAGKPCGIFAGSAEAAKIYAQQGFDFIAISVDATILLDAYKRLLHLVR